MHHVFKIIKVKSLNKSKIKIKVNIGNMREREREREREHPFICLLTCNPCLLIGTLNNNDKKEWKLIKIVEVAKFPNWHKSISIPNKTIKTKWEICRYIYKP